jgi:uncharacterized protein YkwD
MPRPPRPTARTSGRSPRFAHEPTSLVLLEGLEPRQLLAAFNPTADEQYMLELLNRMRMDPQAELAHLTSSLGAQARSADPQVDSALRFFKTKGTILAQQWASLTPAPPLAWNDKLQLAAERHSQVMIDTDTQTHQAPGEPDIGGQAEAAGYTGWSNLGQSVYAFAESVFHAHAGFAIDWGGDPNDPTTTGIQDPPGHRETMMNPAFREVGIRILPSPRTNGRQTGPLVVTQDFGRRFAQGNPFLLGVVYADTSSDGYSAGEGLANVTITAVGDNGTPGAPTFTTTTMSAGGWQMQVPAGVYRVTVSGGSFGSAVYSNVTVGSQNVKLDAVKGVLPPAPDLQVWANNRYIFPGDTTPSALDFTDFGNANVTQQSNVRDFQVRNGGTLALNLSGVSRVRITGANASDFTVEVLPTATIAPGGNQPLRIRFDPSAYGLRTATVTIVSDDPDTPSYAFSIQGRGVYRPIVQVSGKQVVIPSGDTTPTTADWTNFAGIDALDATKVRIFTVTNSGLKNLTFTGPVTLSGADAAKFVVFVQPGSVLAPGQSAQFRVRFTPAGQVGLARATVSVPTDDPLTPVATFDIQGNGLAKPRAQISGGGVAIPAGDTTPSAADKTTFGTLSVAAGALARLYTITNTGLAALSLTGTPRVTITGPDAADFAVSLQPLLALLAPGQSTTFKVRFAPTDAGPRTALVNLFTDDARAPIYTFTISGAGA